MKKMAIKLIILLLVFLLLAFFNPSKEDFIDWAAEQLQRDTNSELEQFLGEVLARPIFKLATTRQDYFLLSIFWLDLNDQDIIYIGILKNFFRLK